MQEKNKYRLLYVSRYLGEFLFYCVFPLYLKNLNYSGTIIGTILSFSPFLLAFALPFWSKFDDGNARKIVLIIAAVLTTVMEFLLAVPFDILPIVIITIIYSIVKAPFIPSVDSMVTLYALEKNIEFSSMRTYGSLGFTISYVIATIVFDKIDFLWIVVLSALFFIVMIIITITLHPLSIDKNNLKKKKGSFKVLLKNYNFITFAITQILVVAPFLINVNFSILYLDYRGYATYLLGLITVGRVGIEMFFFSIASKLKMSYKKMFLFMPIFFIIQSFFYYLNVSLPLIIIFTIITGFSSGSMVFLSNKYIANVVRAENITIATYSITFILYLFIGIYTVLGGIVIDYLGINYIYLFTGILFIISIIFIMVFIKDVKNKVPE